MIEAAFSLLRLGHLEDAEEAFRRAIKIDPESVDALNGLGLVLKKLGRHQDAEKEFQLALKIDPDNLEANNKRFIRANKILHELFNIYMSPEIPPDIKQKKLASIVAKNHQIIYNDDKFMELLNSEIDKTTKHGPAIMALMYLEMRWAITGDNQHHKEMKEYQERASKMDFKGLTDIDFDK